MWCAIILRTTLRCPLLAEYVLSRDLATCGACTLDEVYSDKYTTSREVQFLRVHCIKSKHGLNTGVMGRIHELCKGGNPYGQLKVYHILNGNAVSYSNH